MYVPIYQKNNSIQESKKNFKCAACADDDEDVALITIRPLSNRV